FETVDAAVAWLEAHPRSLVELTLATDDFLTAEERRRLYSAHEGIVAIIPVVKSAPDATGESRREINLDQSMEVLFRDYFRYRHQDQEPPDDLMALFREILSAEEKE
ncbi:MAG: exonuclease sbcCD subunit D, partial [Calditrichaeota bacterium]|nr:exonuclease sbcCD subunit D [Calditrichota bacterium]